MGKLSADERERLGRIAYECIPGRIDRVGHGWECLTEYSKECCRTMAETIVEAILPNCHDCGVKPGEFHIAGCDVEPCPRCGHQSIACNCIYEVCGIDVDTMEEKHPDIYRDGPTKEMYATWDREWAHRRIPWSGEHPGAAECREYGLHARLIPGSGWVACGSDVPDATEDLNGLMSWGTWDQDRQRWVISPTQLEHLRRTRK